MGVAAATGNEGSAVTFTVTLSPASGRTVTVLAATSIGTSDTATTTDFTAVSQTVTFAPGDRSKTVRVATDNDALDEADTETFTLTLSNPTNAALAADPTATGTITDDDDGADGGRGGRDRRTRAAP